MEGSVIEYSEEEESMMDLNMEENVYMGVDDKESEILGETLQSIEQRYLSGDMMAFGKKQQVIFASFQEIRQQQAKVAILQIEHSKELLLSRDDDSSYVKTRVDNDLKRAMKVRESELDILANEMKIIANDLIELNPALHQH